MCACVVLAISNDDDGCEYKFNQLICVYDVRALEPINEVRPMSRHQHDADVTATKTNRTKSTTRNKITRFNKYLMG